MRKLKYQGGLTKIITSRIGAMNKDRFVQFVESSKGTLCGNFNSSPINMDLVSFSSSKDFYDQVLSILSFLRYVGRPTSWTLYSDGSHTKKQIELLHTEFEFMNVVSVDFMDTGNLPAINNLLLPYQPELFDYAKKQPLGKKLFLYLNHQVNNPTIFLDSDILFYSNASVFNTLLHEQSNGWYLPELSWGCLDSRYKNAYPRQLYQANSGFLFFNKSFSHISEGLEFLRSLDYKYEYFSEQTVMHILLKANGFMPLDPRVFILDSSDQFDFSYLYPKKRMAIRHYTGPVRHKMWQKDWRWQLSLS